MRDYKPRAIRSHRSGRRPVGASLGAPRAGCRWRCSPTSSACRRRNPMLDSRVYALARAMSIPAPHRRLRTLPQTGSRLSTPCVSSATTRPRASSSMPTARRARARVDRRGTILQGALWSALDAKWIAPARCERLSIDAGAAVINERRPQHSRQARGRRRCASSFVREHAGIAAVEKDYVRRPVVANFSCEKAHSNTAFQWFQGGPVLACCRFPAGRSR